MQEVAVSQTEGALFDASFYLLRKGVDSNGGLQNPRIGGIASCESMDVEGDEILKKHLDVTYAATRGYINWDHSRSVNDQIGYLTKAVIINAHEIPRYEDLLRTTLSKSASLYVEGELYGHAKHAQQVGDLLKSIPDGQPGALGMSVEGSRVADKNTGKLVKAIVRGVAVTPAPAHPETCARILKSLGLELNSSLEGVELSKAVKHGLSYAEVVVKIMELRPKVPLDLAKKIATHVFKTQR